MNEYKYIIDNEAYCHKQEEWKKENKRWLLGDILRGMEKGAGGAQTNPDCQLAGVVPRWAADPPQGCYISHDKEPLVWKKKK